MTYFQKQFNWKWSFLYSCLISGISFQKPPPNNQTWYLIQPPKLPTVIKMPIVQVSPRIVFNLPVLKMYLMQKRRGKLATTCVHYRCHHFSAGWSWVIVIVVVRRRWCEHFLIEMYTRVFRNTNPEFDDFNFFRPGQGQTFVKFWGRVGRSRSLPEFRAPRFSHQIQDTEKMLTMTRSGCTTTEIKFIERNRAAVIKCRNLWIIFYTFDIFVVYLVICAKMFLGFYRVRVARLGKVFFGGGCALVLFIPFTALAGDWWSWSSGTWSWRVCVV